MCFLPSVISWCYLGFAVGDGLLVESEISAAVITICQRCSQNREQIENFFTYWTTFVMAYRVCNSDSEGYIGSGTRQEGLEMGNILMEILFPWNHKEP